MRFRLFLAALLLFVGIAPPALAAAPPTPHVFLLVMENHGASQEMQHAYVQSLAKQYAMASNYSGVMNPSLPNYLALTAGQWKEDTGTHASWNNQPLDNPTPPNVPFNIPNLFGQLQSAGISWGAYAGGYPSGGMPSGWNYRS